MLKLQDLLETLRAQGVAQATFSEGGALLAVSFFDGPPLPAKDEPSTVELTNQAVGKDGLTREQQLEHYGTALDSFEG